MRDAALGVVLTTVWTVVAWLVWGGQAILPAASFGALAAVLHVVAVALLKPALGGSFNQLMARWAMGLGLRLLGVVVFALVVFIERDLFPPLPAAVGFAGVLLPLLFTEMRLIR
jgi:uncharacterized membrane protein YhdT